MGFFWYFWAIIITAAIVYEGVTTHHLNKAIVAHNEILRTLIEEHEGR